eukprot:TRINITY_DN3838_c0_g1_i2.p1 TRINITY_DN3838_c0_g1~~TRINITY_DN3838_c0_g1_i2.p1  ORF type:complete len:173 (+),score=42.41 TRINITY_DN3838_c0_g1_i2:966-1484(+)
MGDPYIKCGSCSAVYTIDPQMLGERGRRVQCSVCDHSWFQASERVFRLGNGFSMKDFPEEKLAAIKANLEQGLTAGGAPKGNGRKGEMTMFVGNLPFSFGEKDLSDLFADHGEVVSAVIIKDNMDRSKGYGFVEMLNKAQGQAAMDTLHNYQINGRPITVRDGSTSRDGNRR